MASQLQDRAPGLAGLIIGAAVIFVILISIIELTNRKFEGHDATAVEATK